MTAELSLALYFGILTSISPCPLAANITAVSYISRKIAQPKAAILAGILYMTGRSAAYLLVAFVSIKGLMAVPGLSFFLQKNMYAVMGPLMIFIGAVMLDLFAFSINILPKSEIMQKWADKIGISGSFFLGFIFALAFCPVSAGLFFGALIPLAVKNSSAFLLPLSYGIGTALPVLGFALVIAFSAHAVGRIFNAVSSIEKWARRVTAAVFIITGVYLTLKYFMIL